MPYWSKLCEAIKMNKIPYQLVEKQPYFQAQIQQNEKFEVFHNMMSKTSEQLQLDTYFAAKKDWHCIKTIIDIGGGSGEIIVKFLEYYRNAQGVVIDLQHVQQKAEEKLALYGFDSRCTFQAGDFFMQCHGQVISIFYREFSMIGRMKQQLQFYVILPKV